MLADLRAVNRVFKPMSPWQPGIPLLSLIKVGDLLFVSTGHMES